MADTFDIGEVALVVGPPAGLNNDHGFQEGDEVTVVEGLKIRQFGHGERLWSYVVTRDGRRYRAVPEWLRKRRLPPQRQEIGEWELCPWRPSVSTVSEKP